MKRAKLAWLFGVALVLAGFIPVLVFAVGSLIPAAEASAALSLFPELPWLASIESWLSARRVRWSPPIGLVYALPGLAIMYLGAAIARSQQPVFEAMQSRRQDASRRRQQYGSVERIEPTLNAVD